MEKISNLFSCIYLIIKKKNLIVYLFSHTQYFSLLLLEVFFFRHRSLWLYVFSYVAAFYVQAALTLSQIHIKCMSRFIEHNLLPLLLETHVSSSLWTLVHVGHTKLNIL